MNELFRNYRHFSALITLCLLLVACDSKSEGVDPANIRLADPLERTSSQTSGSNSPNPNAEDDDTISEDGEATAPIPPSSKPLDRIISETVFGSSKPKIGSASPNTLTEIIGNTILDDIFSDGKLHCSKSSTPQDSTIITNAVIRPKPENKRVLKFPILQDQFINSVYNFGVSQWSSAADFQQQMGTDWTNLNERLIRLLALHNINVLDIGTRPIEQYIQLAKKYDMKLMSFDSALDPSLRTYSFDGGIATWIEKYLTPYSKNESILSWRILDEPPVHSSRIKSYLEIFEKARTKLFEHDTLHPVSVQTNNASKDYSSQADLYFGEIYNLLYADFKGRDDFRLIEKDMRSTSFSSRGINAYTLWANGYGGYVPTKVDVRNMMYTVLANGGNGWQWYRGTIFPAPWVKDTPALKYSLLRQTSIAENFDTASPMLEEIKNVSDLILPLGSLFTRATFLSSHSINVESCSYDYVGTDFSYEKKLLEINDMSNAAVNVGVWDAGDALLIVLHNRNLHATESAIVDFSRLGEGLSVYDGYTLEKINLSTEGKMPLISLNAGDGRVLLVATNDDFVKITKEVFSNQYRNARRRYIVLQDIWGKVLPFNSYASFYNLAEKDANNGDPQNAYLKMNSGLQAIYKGFSSNAELANGLSELSKLKSKLYDASRLLRKYLPLFINENEQSLSVTDPSNILLNESVTELQKESGEFANAINNLRTVSASYSSAASALENGVAHAAAQITTMRETVDYAVDELMKWGPSSVASDEKVALVRIGEPLSDQIFDIATCGKLGSKNFDVLKYTNGKITNNAGEEQDAQEYDVLWIHEDFRGKSTSLISSSLKTDVESFLQNGKGVLLSGHAVQLIPTIISGEVKPNIVNKGEHGFFSKLQRDEQYTKWQQIGFTPRTDFANHPIFSGLNKNAMWLGHESLLRVIDRSTWVYPVTPKKGRVLAGFSTSLRPPANDYNYDIVEYGGGDFGKLIAMGTGICDLRKSNSGVQHAKNAIQLFSNIFSYLDQTTPTYSGKNGVEGGLYFNNVASSSNNSKLSWQISSNEHGRELFDNSLKLGERWQTAGSDSSIEIDLGGVTTINKVHLFVGWDGSVTANVGYAEFYVYDEALAKFVKPVGGNIFSGDGRFGITFNFKPFSTSRIRIEQIKPYPVDSGRPVGINEIIVYGY